VIDYLAVIRSESARFLELVRTTPMDVAVPSCPGWTVADLTWHLGEVQHFWSRIVATLLTDPDAVDTPDRPVDSALADFLAEQSQALVDALAARHPEEVCWSWYDVDTTVGFSRRRQAHEALIHRIDAELAAGTTFRIDTELAADGVDEIVRIFLDVDNLPEWAALDPHDATAVIAIDDGSASWAMELGRFRGTSPNSGRTYDFPAISLIEPPVRPTAILRGGAVDLDLWLWGRGPLDPISVEGDHAVADHIRAAAVQATQ